MQYRRDECSRNFVIANKVDEKNDYVRTGSHCCILYEEKKRNGSSGPLQMKSLILPPFSVFVGNRNVQRAGAANLGHSQIRYRIQLVAKVIKLPYTIAFSYVGGFEIKKWLDSMH